MKALSMRQPWAPFLGNSCCPMARHVEKFKVLAIGGK